MRLAATLFLTAALATAQVKLPDYQHSTLPNGVTLDLIEKHDVPMITVRAIFRGGAEADPPAQAGLGYITAEMLRRGSATRSADEFSQQLDFLGASFGTTITRQATIVSMEFLSKDAPKALDLMADALLKPAFPEDELKKVLSQEIDEAKSIKDNPGQANAAWFRAFYFPETHPYSRSASGDEVSLATIRRDNIVRYHARQYVGLNLILIAAGDLDTSFRTTLTKLLGAMPAGEAYPWVKQVPPLDRDAARLLLIDKPDATQTYFRIARPGIDHNDPDRIPLWIVDTLFGGRFTSLLNDALRVNSGLTYGARSVLDEDRLQGSNQISSYTRTETTVKAIDMALDVLRTLAEKGIDAAQLASAKAYLKGHFPTDQLETNDQLAATIGELELFGLDRSEIDTLFARIDAVTLDQANSIARKYYRADNLQFCLLGNAAAIREQVKKYAPKMQTIAVTEPGYPIPAF